MLEPMMNQGAEDPLQDVKALVANWMKCLNDMQQPHHEGRKGIHGHPAPRREH